MHDRPNVILFMMDALRPDHLQPWGGRDRATPNFQRIADEGAFFRNFFGHMPSSFNARASVMTGRDPHTHGVRINGRPLPAHEITLAQILAGAGYATALSRPYPRGMNRGFARNDLNAPFVDSPGAVREVLPSLTGGEAATDMAEDTASLVQWLRDRASSGDGRPFLLWADEEFSHGPWNPPAPYDTMFNEAAASADASQESYAPGLSEDAARGTIDRFDGCVACIDRILGLLLDELDTLGLAENTLVIVMSDHGQLLGELDFWGKPPVLLDPVLRSALLMRLPGVVRAGVQPEGLAIMNDVFATVLDALGLDLPDAAHGQSMNLRPLWEGVGDVREHLGLEFNRYRGTAGKGIRTRRWKYIHYASLGAEPWGTFSPAEMWAKQGWDRTVLFDLDADPGETRDVKAEHPDVVAEMQERLITWLIDSENDVPAPDPGD